MTHPRLALYRQALARATNPAQPYRTLAVLTTDLPGEAIEVAIMREDGSPFVRRAFPTSEIAPGAHNVHGLTKADLLGEVPLADWRDDLLAELRGFTVRAWAGTFTLQAINAALTAGGAEPIQGSLVSVQAVLHGADPEEVYPPSLRSVCTLLGLPLPDPRSALSAAQATRAVVDTLLSSKGHHHNTGTAP